MKEIFNWFTGLEWYTSTIIILVVLGIVCLVIYSKGIRKIVYSLVLEAEERFLSQKKSGEIKYQYVIERVRPLIPTILRWYFTDEKLDVIIEACVTKMKHFLSK